MRETVAPGKLLDRRKITTVAGVLPHGCPTVDCGKSNGLRPPCVIRAIFQKHFQQRVIDFTRTDKFMTQFGDRLDPIIRPCGTSIVNRGFGTSTEISKAGTLDPGTSNLEASCVLGSSSAGARVVKS
jgi:hypothetical protein